VERGRVHSLADSGVHVRAIDPDGTQYVTTHPSSRGWKTTLYDRATNREVDLVEPVQHGRLEFCGGRLFEIDENGDFVGRDLATGARKPVLAAMSHEFGTVSIPDDGTEILINLTTYSPDRSTTKSFVWSSAGPLELREGLGFYFGESPDIAFTQYRNVVQAWSAHTGAPLNIVREDGTSYDGRHGRPQCADANARECIAETRITDPATNWVRHESFAYVDADGRRTPFEEYGGQEPNGLLMPRDARYAMSYFNDGTIFFYPPRGGDAVAFRPFADGTGGYLRTKEGKLELFGAAESRAVCRIGSFSLPIATCPELVTTGLLRERLGARDP